MAMKLKVKATVLQEALGNLVEIERLTHEEITERSKAHNIGRIISGETIPTANTWQRLHKAFPKEVPPLIWTDGKTDYHQVIGGSKVVSTGNNNRLAGGDYHETFQVSARERTLVELLRERDKDGSIMKEFLSKLLHD